jgi:hypothetical protein
MKEVYVGKVQKNSHPFAVFLPRFFCGKFYKLRTTLFLIGMRKSVVKELISEVYICQ